MASQKKLLRRDFLAQRTGLFALALAGGLVLTPAAEAATFLLKGTFSKSLVYSTCKKYGGTYDENSGGYGCSAKNGNTVSCDSKGTCHGYTPLVKDVAGFKVDGLTQFDAILK